MTPAQFAAELRDTLLDAHENASDVYLGVSSCDMETCRPGVEYRLRAIVLFQAEQHALLTMKLAHLLDAFADQAAEAEDGDEWKR